jgi:hypothetical protein
MWTVPIKPYADSIKICDEETLKFRREDLPQFEVHVVCYRILTPEERAAVQEIVCKQLLRKRPAASVKIELEQGGFQEALCLLGDSLGRLFAR